ncbi:uncharacterized protein At5g39865-like [Primulina tabacum]|uniref:uncharacterized protein At5g39865-like n=1 Tax=Primulina tabacum TaxID=48773 RepID=UPI003F5A164D
MGCTASCPTNFISQSKNPSFNSSPTHWNSQSVSPYHSFSEPSATPVSRTLSLPTPLIHHPPLREGDSNHFVSLTSSTYGSLVLINPPDPIFKGQDFDHPVVPTKKVQDFGNSEDPLSPDSVINTWELMEGLDEEEFDFHMVGYPRNPGKAEVDDTEILSSYEFVEEPKYKPLWKHLSDESSLSKIESDDGLSSCENGMSKPEKVDSLVSGESCDLSGPEDRIVLYYTSLRGIRKTYEDCCMVRVILSGFRVCVDERDISMDCSYRKELQGALKGKAVVGLPQVFVKGNHIGGAEEIKQLNETGELAKLLKGFPVMNWGFVCESCGDVRFVPCSNCNGSRKVYDDEEGSLSRCPECNENGLTRCPFCCP